MKFLRLTHLFITIVGQSLSINKWGIAKDDRGGLWPIIDDLDIQPPRSSNVYLEIICNFVTIIT